MKLVAENALYHQKNKQSIMVKYSIIFIIILVYVLGCSKQDNKNNIQTKLKVGLVFDVGGRGDKSFNDAAYRGLENAKKELGIEFEYIEPGPGADREAALRQFAIRDDIKLILGIGFIFTDDITNMANEFPQKLFACVDYTYDSNKSIPQNLVALNFKEEEGSFLVGALGALVTKTNKIGFIGGMQSPLIKKFEVGYLAGAKYVKPDCEVQIAYAGVTGDAFKNPGKGKELALGQFSRGVDIIYHASGVTGLGVIEAAREKKKLVIGVDSDQYHEAPGFILTSMTKIVDIAVYETIKDVIENKFQGGRSVVFDLKSKGIDYVYNEYNKNLIPDSVHKRVEEIRSGIIVGTITVPSK